MRKLIAVLLTLTLILGLSSTAFAAKPKTLEIYWIANATKDTADLWTPIKEGVEEAINEYIEPLINAHVHFNLVNWDDWADDALKPLLEGEKIDLIFTADWRDYVEEISKDALIPLSVDQLDKNGQDILNSLPKAFLEGVTYKGQIYGVPTNKELCVPCGIIVNKTAAELIGWDVEASKEKGITTPELEEYLAAYKAKFPGRYPYLMENGRWADEPWCPDWIGIEGNAVAMKMAKNEDGTFDETIYNIYETEEQEAHIRLMYDWAQKGYIDPKAYSYNYNKIFGTGDFLVYTQPLKGNDLKSAEMIEANYDKDLPKFECTEIIMQPKYIVTT